MPAHPVFSLVGLRPIVSQHTDDEDALLRSLAANSRNVVELGVAEGGSARSLREAMPGDGTLWLVDPYMPGRLPINVSQFVARKAVRGAGRADVRWIKALSWDAAAMWTGPAIDFLFIDADHSYDAIVRDFSEWEPHVAPAGTIGFHDTNPCSWIGEDSEQVAAMRAILDRGKWRVTTTVDSTTVIMRADRTVDQELPAQG